MVESVEGTEAGRINSIEDECECDTRLTLPAAALGTRVRCLVKRHVRLSLFTVTKGIATSSKKLLGAPGIATRSILTTRNKGRY